MRSNGWLMALAFGALLGVPALFAGEADKVPMPDEQGINQAFLLFTMAQMDAQDFLSNKKPDATRDELFAKLKDNPDVFNIVATTSNKQKNEAVSTQHAFHPDEDHMLIKQTGKEIEKGGVTFKSGLTKDGQPVWIASKTYPAAAGEKKFLGGELILIVNAAAAK